MQGRRLVRSRSRSRRWRPGLRSPAATEQSEPETEQGAVGERGEAAYRPDMSSDPLRDRFERVDRDHNGKIDQAELSELLQALGVGFTDAQVRATFEGIDRDGSGLIELEELRAWWTTR